MIEAVEAVKVPLESPAVDRRIKPKMEDEESNSSASFKFVPYVETTKPFEMSDFYKYSTKFKKSKTGSESSSTSSNDNNNKPPGTFDHKYSSLFCQMVCNVKSNLFFLFFFGRTASEKLTCQISTSTTSSTKEFEKSPQRIDVQFGRFVFK